MAFGALLAGLAPAVAQPAGSARERATARFKQGREFFKAGDYDHAIAEYEAAYQLSNEPLLIFNIALCHDRARRPEQALEAFQRYLRFAPSGEVADEAREDVVRLTRIVDAVRARRTAEETERADQSRQDEAARTAAAAEQTQREEAERVGKQRAARDRVDRLASRAQYERWGGIAAIAAGAVFAGIATKYGLDAQSIANDFTNHRGAWTDAMLARDAEGHAAENQMVVFGALSGAAIVGGSILYFVGRSHDATALQLRLELQTAPSVSVSGRF